MTTQQLKVSLVDLSAAAESLYWLTIMAVDQGGDGAGMDEAASFIDSLFDIESCDPDADQDGGEETPQDEQGNLEPPMTPEQFKQMVHDFMSGRSEVCTTRDGSYEAVLRVGRSHQEVPYKLVLDNGEVVQTVQIEAVVNVPVSVAEQSSHTMDIPIAVVPVIVWQGQVYDRLGQCDPPEVEVIGSTLNFGKVITGDMLVHFPTVYDLVTVKVFAKDDESPLDIPGSDKLELQDCNVLGFYHGQVVDHTITPPRPEEMDEGEKDKLCGSTHLNLGGNEDTVSCYDLVTSVTRCRCSGTVVKSTVAKVSVECPETVKYCPGILEECEGLRQTRTVTEGYVECPGEEDMAWSVSDPSYYLDRCCESPPASMVLPPCKTITSVYRGGKGLSTAVRAKYPGALFVPVGPGEKGICGTTTIKYNTAGYNCCDGVLPIVWDSGSSVSILSPNSSGVIAVTGGKAPYTWKIRGNGFSFSPSGYVIRDAVTMSPVVTVYAMDDACGTCFVYVTDGCSSVDNMILSTAGRWSLLNWYVNLEAWPVYSTIESMSVSCLAYGYNQRPLYDQIVGNMAVTIGGDIGRDPDPSFERWSSYALNDRCFCSNPDSLIMQEVPGVPGVSLPIFNGGTGPLSGYPFCGGTIWLRRMLWNHVCILEWVC